jgi:Disaggregatase related
MVQTQYVRSGGMTVRFGDGIMAPVDPLFADPANGDFHLKSTAGRWTPQGYVRDPVVSPAIAKGYPPDGPAEQNPERAGRRNELGAYGNSGEASYVR